jgi:hypothetical protein
MVSHALQTPNARVETFKRLSLELKNLVLTYVTEKSLLLRKVLLIGSIYLLERYHDSNCLILELVIALPLSTCMFNRTAAISYTRITMKIFKDQSCKALIDGTSTYEDGFSTSCKKMTNFINGSLVYGRHYRNENLNQRAVSSEGFSFSNPLRGLAPSLFLFFNT